MLIFWMEGVEEMPSRSLVHNFNIVRFPAHGESSGCIIDSLTDRHAWLIKK